MRFGRHGCFFVLCSVFALLLTGCFGPVRSPAPRIVVEWSVVPVPLEPNRTLLAASHDDDEGNDGDEVSVEAKREIGWAGTPVQGSLVRVQARLVGGVQENPRFEFEVASERPITHYLEGDNILTMEPDSENRGVVRVTHGSQEAVVPFSILPSAFLTSWPERYVDWAEGAVSSGILLSTGTPTNDIDEADLYVDERGEVYAPHGWAQIPMHNPWDGFAQDLDVADLEFRNGAFGIAGAEGIPSLAFPNLWVVKTGSGGYARLKFQFVRWNQDWGIVYEYSPTGAFEAL